jgi:hypothetical protein
VFVERFKDEEIGWSSELHCARVPYVPFRW